MPAVSIGPGGGLLLLELHLEAQAAAGDRLILLLQPAFLAAEAAAAAEAENAASAELSK